MSPGLKGRLGAAAAAVLWSTGGLAIKLADQPAPRIAAGRAVLAALALLLLLPPARRFPGRAGLGAAAAYAITATLFVQANTLTTAANAIFIQNTAPVWVLLLAPWITGERASRRELWRVPIALFGCALFFADDLAPGRLEGNLISALASVSYAVQILAWRRVGPDRALGSTVLGNLAVVLVCLPWLAEGPAPTAGGLAAIAYLGLVQQAVATVVFVRALAHISALEASLVLLLEPLCSPLWAFAGVGETVGPLGLLGAAVVLGVIGAEAVLRTGSARRNAP